MMALLRERSQEPATDLGLRDQSAYPQSIDFTAPPGSYFSPLVSALRPQPLHPKKAGGIHTPSSSRPVSVASISPTIKPLLPGSNATENAASLLLASKSNYQNILEGTHLPRVSYPTELSTNLTSKRTSTKLPRKAAETVSTWH